MNRLLLSLLIAAGVLPAVGRAATYEYRIPEFGRLQALATGAGLLSTNALVFPGTTVVGLTSNPLTVQYSNVGGSALHLKALQVAGPFTADHNCPSLLAAGSECQMSVAFAPTASGPLAGTLTISTEEEPTPAVLGLFGTGSDAPPAPQARAELTPNVFAFGDVRGGGSFLSDTITLNNAGNAAMTGIAFALPSGFSLSSNTCGTSLAAGSSCTFQILFAPVAGQTYQGDLTLTSSAATQTLTLTGNGMVVASDGVSAGTLDFGGVLVGASSAAKSVQLTNTGNVAISVGQVTASGDYAASTNCAGSLPAGAYCNVNAVFSPMVGGTDNGALTIPTSTGTQTVALTGVGLFAQASLSPGSLGFGDVTGGATATSTPVTLLNTGNTTLTNIAITPPAGFTVVGSNCGSTLAAGASCSFQVQFAPTPGQAYSASLTLSSSGTPQSLALSGYGVANPSDTVSLGSLAFGNVRVGATSAAQSVQLANTGNVPITIGQVSTSTTDYHAATDCTASLLVGSSCTINTTFSPSVAAAVPGVLTIPTSAGDKSVTLSGTGVAPRVAVSAGSLSFSATALGAGAPQSVLVTNKGTAPAVLTSVVVSGARFNATENCSGKTLAANGTDSCTVSVSYAPTAYGVTDTGTVTLNESGSAAASFNVSGSAQSATPVFSIGGTAVTSYSLGALQSGSAGSAQVSVSNTGAEPLVVGSLTGSGLTVSGCAPGTTLMQGQACTATVSYTPGLVTSETLENHTLTLAYNSSHNAAITLTDTPYGGWLSSSVAAYDFGAKAYGGTYTSAGIVITNSGTRAVHMGSATLSQLLSNNADVTANHNCPATLAAGANCTVIISYKPSGSGVLPLGAAVTLNSDGLQTPSGASKGDIVLSVAGSSTAAVLGAPATSFTAVPLSTQTMLIPLTNSGNQTATLISATPSGASSAKFSVDLNGCSTIAAGNSCSIKVTYSPTSVVTVPEVATLDVGYSGGPSSLAIPLTGTTDNTNADPYFSNVVLLMHMDGANTSTTLTDVTGLPVSDVLGPLTTSVSVFGGASLAVGTQTRVTVPSSRFTFTGDYTQEFWAFYGASSLGGIHAYLDTSNGSSTGTQFALYNGALRFYCGGGTFAGATGPVANTWHHIAATRQSGTVRLFVDGIQVGSTVYAATNTPGQSVMAINYQTKGGPTYTAEGYIEEVRITNGVARYTSNFAVPTRPSPNY